MEREGLIEADVQRTGERERRVYRVLDAGLEYLQRWASEPVVYSGERDAAHLKASMMHLLSLEECGALFRAHLNYYRQRVLIWETRIEAIQTGRSTILRARLATMEPKDHAKLIAFKLCSYEGSVMRANAEIEWAERGLATVDSLRANEAASTAKSPSRGTARAGGPRDKVPAGADLQG
jgi:PadR family transcriptional regulator, regulatory protein AphA